MSSDSINDGYSRIKCIVFYYSVHLIANVTPCLGVCASRTVLIRLAMYGAGSALVPKKNACPLCDLEA